MVNCFWFLIFGGLFKFSYFKLYIKTMKSDYTIVAVLSIECNKLWILDNWIRNLILESIDYNTAASVYQIHFYSGNFWIIKRIIYILFSYTTPFYGVGKFFYAPDVKKLFTGESLLHFFYQFALSSTATTISSGTNLVVSININAYFWSFQHNIPQPTYFNFSPG